MGERQVVFVTGEPGIGKTTLVEAFLAQAATQVSCGSALGSASNTMGQAKPTCQC